MKNTFLPGINMRRLFTTIFLSLIFFSSIVAANPLPGNQAFKFSAELGSQHLLLASWEMAPGYYLYRDRFEITIIDPPSAQLGTIKFPHGIKKTDEILGDHEVYLHHLSLPVPIKNAHDKLTQLKINYQGCSEAGFCYPPIEKLVSIDFSSMAVSTTTFHQKARHDRITTFIEEKNVWLILFAFFGFGLLLTFTPCVLPMIPILSSIIVGQQKPVKLHRSFLLSFCYVLGVAFSFALAGVFAGVIGHSLQAAFQKTWVLLLLSFLFVGLALSLFGFYQLQLPAFIRNRINKLNKNQRTGSYIGAAIMGVLSILIVSPCVSAPLVGALAYISKTGDAALGGLALMMTGFGMGIPLIIIGVAGGVLLPKAGAWMNGIKIFFGIVLLGMAIWLLERIIPGPMGLILWAILLIVSSLYLRIFRKSQTGWQRFRKGLGICVFVYGILLMIGSAMGNNNVLNPLEYHHSALSSPTKALPETLFTPVDSLAAVQRALTNAKLENKPVILDFFAQWCVACKIMEHAVFSHAEVQRVLQPMIRLRVDVTANSSKDKAILHHFGIIAPPAVLFFNRKGFELKHARIVGEVSKEEFLKQLSTLE